MTKLTANNEWIPFITKIARREYTQNIDYGNLAIRLPLISHITGHNLLLQYEFSDSTLTYLLNELLVWNGEQKGKK